MDLFYNSDSNNSLFNDSDVFSQVNPLISNNDDGLPFVSVFPTSPNLLTGYSFFGTIVLNWAEPTSYGNSSAIAYNVFQDGVLLTSSPIYETTYTINNLSPNTSYTFSIVPINGNGYIGVGSYITLNSACFKKGTKILYFNEETNLEEYILIEKLRKGMKVKTSLDGYKKIELICKSNLYNTFKDKKNKDGLYKLTNANYPELFEDLYITGAHSVLVNYLTDEQRTDIKNLLNDVYVTGDKYRLPVCFDEKAEPYNEEKDFEVWHFALENENYFGNYGIYANGLLVETCSIRYIKEMLNCEIIE